jgi:hypothetical protein
MTKTSRSIQLVLAATTLASLAACGSSSGPTPINGTGGSTTGAGGGAVASGGSDTASGGALSSLAHPIPFHGAWTPGTENVPAIQGAFYILEDAVKDGAAITGDGLDHTQFLPEPPVGPADPPHSFDTTSPGPCITGTAKQVLDPANTTTPPYDLIWGGGIGMNLNEKGGEGSTPMPFDANMNGITGFEFKLSGDPGAGEIRFKATMAGSSEDFCFKISPILPNSTIQVHFSQLEHKCWEMPPKDVETIDVSKLQALQWQVVTNEKTPYIVKNFCVTELGYLVD